MVFEDDNVVRNMQTQPCAFADGFGREKRVEQVGHNFARNPGTIIANFHTEMVGFAVGAKRQRTFALHRINCVVNDIRPHLIEFAGVCSIFGKLRA